MELRFGQRSGCLVEWWQLLLSPSHSNILDVTRPQTNSDSVCVICVRVKCSLTLSTCLSKELALQQKKKTGPEVSSAKRQCLCIDAWSCGQSSVRDEVRDTYVMRKPSWCWLGAVPRYWNAVASCFHFISFVENTSAALAPRAGISQPILLLFFLFSSS